MLGSAKWYMPTNESKISKWKFSFLVFFAIFGPLRMHDFVPLISRFQTAPDGVPRHAAWLYHMYGSSDGL